MDCSLPGSSVHGIFQARILEWVAISRSHHQSISLHPTHHIQPISKAVSQIYAFLSILCWRHVLIWTVIRAPSLFCTEAILWVFPHAAARVGVSISHQVTCLLKALNAHSLGTKPKLPDTAGTLPASLTWSYIWSPSLSESPSHHLHWPR